MPQAPCIRWRSMRAIYALSTDDQLSLYGCTEIFYMIYSASFLQMPQRYDVLANYACAENALAAKSTLKQSIWCVMAFEPGRSGNPDGRKRSARLRALAQTHAEDCVTALASVRDDASAPAEARVEAAALILDLAGRKASLPVSGAEHARRRMELA